ncbi:hypothetical protein GGR50DRAFT_650278 [Xylaria sp. CBS 124048]|nr:hypothetical protein GGR50DRAFT_650278 [Xylaria sp. CBS 124048]
MILEDTFRISSRLFVISVLFVFVFIFVFVLLFSAPFYTHPLGYIHALITPPFGALSVCPCVRTIHWYRIGL